MQPLKDRKVVKIVIKNLIDTSLESHKSGPESRSEMLPGSLHIIHHQYKLKYLYQPSYNNTKQAYLLKNRYTKISKTIISTAFAKNFYFLTQLFYPWYH